jgi:hypothetical protein
VIKVFVILLLLAWVAGGIWFFTGPAKAANRYVDELTASITRRDDAVLFRQLYRNKQPRNVVLAWVLTAFLSPTIAYIYGRQWVKMLLSFFTLQGAGVWWLVSIFSMPFEIMNLNKRLADQAYAELRLARPELFGGAGRVHNPNPNGLNPEALTRVGDMRRMEVIASPAVVERTPAAVATVAPRPTRSCPSCGRAQRGDDRFCAGCGQAAS